MNWRALIYEILTTDPGVTAVVPPEHVHQASDLREPPKYDPFLVLRSTPPAVRAPFAGARYTAFELWAHDRSRSYVLIDDILERSRLALVFAVSRDAFVAATWEGTSGDLEDDAFGTITRNATVRLAGRNE